MCMNRCVCITDDCTLLFKSVINFGARDGKGGYGTCVPKDLISFEMIYGHTFKILKWTQIQLIPFYVDVFSRSSAHAATELRPTNCIVFTSLQTLFGRLGGSVG